MSQQELKGRVAIVTGAARGQGAEEARHLAKMGASIIAVDVRHEAKEVADEVGGAYWPGDVSDLEMWRALMASVVSDMGRLDILVNNAAVCWNRPIEEESVEEIERALSNNAVGAFLGIQSSIAPMRATGGGSIINVASIAAIRGFKTLSAYSMSKWALRGLTKVAAAELGRDGIRVNTVLPGTVNSPMAWETGLDEEGAKNFSHVALGRVGESSDIASVVGFLASDASVYVTGAEIVVDGGSTLGIPSRPRS
jgi:3alpha(or 20beta)-hydroxysteroid dehydrogenase